MLYINPQHLTEETTLAAILAKSPYTILYFYPKDNTPGCTIEARDFSKHVGDFKKCDAQVIGVSKDSGKSHCGFQEKQDLTIGLIADVDTELAQEFGARGQKKFMGREYMGIMRNTYLLDKKGTILYKREDVSVLGHVNEVLEHVRTLS
jgi:thioredoxin-dependent peroxiredoxin